MSNQQNILATYLIIIGVQIVWGVFSDLKKGQTKWFIGRIGFSIIYSAVINLIMYHNII